MKQWIRLSLVLLFALMAARADARPEDAALEKLVMQVLESVEAADGARLISIVDCDAFAARVNKLVPLDCKIDARMASLFMERAIQSTARDLPEITRVYFVKERMLGSERRLQFRLVDKSNGVVYLEYIFRVDGEKVIVCDLFNSASGEIISELLARMVLRDAIAAQSKDDSFNKDAEIARQMFEALREENFQKVIDLYDTLGPLKRDRLPQMCRLTAACALDGATVERISKNFFENFPDDIGGSLQMIQGYMRMGQLDKAMQAIDRAEQIVDGDPYLNLYRAVIAEQQGDLETARSFVDAGLQQDPMLIELVQYELGLASINKDFVEMKFWLEHMEKYIGPLPDEYLADPFFDDFKKSTEYVLWLKEHNRPLITR